MILAVVGAVGCLCFVEEGGRGLCCKVSGGKGFGVMVGFRACSKCIFGGFWDDDAESSSAGRGGLIDEARRAVRLLLAAEPLCIWFMTHWGRHCFDVGGGGSYPGRVRLCYPSCAG